MRKKAAGKGNKKKIVTAIFGMAVLLLLSPGSHGATISNNLDQPGLGQSVITSSYYKAQKFTTDANTYTLNWVRIRLRANTAGNLFARVYDDNGNLPNAEAGSLIVPSVGPTYDNHTCTPSAPIELSANSTYWVVVGVTDGTGYYDWNYTASNSGSGAGFSTRWAHSINAGSTWSADDTSPHMMQVDVSASPPIPTLNEWGIIILSLLFVVSAYFLIRKRQVA